MNHHEDPLSGPFGTACKFVGAGLFGIFVSSVVLFIMVLVDWEGFWSPPWIHVLWLIPFAWGILGVLRFEEMLDAGSAILEWTCGLR